MFFRARLSSQSHFFVTVVLLYTIGTQHINFYAYATSDSINDVNIESNSANSYDHNISLERFQGLLQTEIHNEIHGLSQSFSSSKRDSEESKTGTRLLGSNWVKNSNRDLTIYPDEAKQHLWDHIVQHGWAMSEILMPKEDEMNQQDSSMNTRFLQVEEQRPVPFLICSVSPLFQGQERLKPMLKHTQALLDDVVIVSNNEYETCFHVTTTSSRARFVSEVLPNEEYIIAPMTDLMKISIDTLGEISKDYWTLPTNEQRGATFSPQEFDVSETYDLSQIRENRFQSHDWERIIYVGFVCGNKKILDEETVYDMAKEIVHDVQKMGQQGANYRRARRMGEVTATKFGEAPTALSISQAFSLTSSTIETTQNTNLRRMQVLDATRAEPLSQSLEQGMEAEHECAEMFERLTIRADDTRGFDIVLNPDSIDEDELYKYKNDETSASNVHCITSLIVALSTHPMVLTVEQVGPVISDDVESQFITQSLIPTDPKISSEKTFDLNYFPLSMHNLNGAGQIISVADSGLDVSHRFFRPKSGDDGKIVFNNWDMSQRKVVRYYTNSGDDKEYPGGHGSKVAGVAVASVEGSKNQEWDGVAKDSKLFIWDMAKKGGGLREPNTSRFFSEIFNGGKGSKIANGSWSIGTSSTYSSRCARYDEQLYNNPQISYFTSAGNSGPNAKTIDDPGLCKNVIAVGSSQSINSRIGNKDLGPGYLADYSSRGPTGDGRIKPEIVAPGYTVLTAYGNHTGKPRDDDTSRTSGTSFSSPIAAGCAAQVRQYYEEGFYPYGDKFAVGSMAFEPSSSLVKATLINGAQRLYGVQDLPGKEILDDSIEFYDSNQGFGLVNLKSSLPIRSVNDNEYKSVVVNDQKLTSSATEYVMVKAVSCYSNSPLSATLAWNDTPGATNCGKCMINGFSLIVEEIGSGGTYYPNGKNARDYDNNSQRVRIDARNGKSYKISVKARPSNFSIESYSLIVTGCFIIEDYDGGMKCTN